MSHHYIKTATGTISVAIVYRQVLIMLALMLLLIVALAVPPSYYKRLLELLLMVQLAPQPWELYQSAIPPS